MPIPKLLRALVLLLGTFAVRAQTPSTDVSVGVFPFLVGNMDARVGEIVGNCQTYGVDTLYVSVFRSTGPSTGELWITDRAGDWNTAWGAVRPGGAGIDLQNLITACHAANVRVVGVLKCFTDTVQPDDLAHRQYLLDVVDYFVDAWQANHQPVYDLDGLALDYVRYVNGNGIAANVTSFVADVREQVGNLSLHAYLVANRYSFDGPVYNGSFASYAATMNALSSQFGQDWQQLASIVDVLLPMAYTADGGIYSSYTLHQAYVRKTAEYARTACALAGQPGRRVCPVVKTYSGDGETTTTQTIEASITGALLGGGDGYQAFRYQYLVNNPSWWPKVQQYAVPGCNWPRPAVAIAGTTVTQGHDASASADVDEPSAGLLARYDFDGDAVFDTAFAPVGPVSHLHRRPGTWFSTVQVQDGDGHVATTRRRVIAGSAVQVAPHFVSVQAGGQLTIQLNAGPMASGHAYLVIAGLTGTSPGFVWHPGFEVALNIDLVTLILAGEPNGPLLWNGAGILDAQGQATAVMTVPAGLAAGYQGQWVSWSFLAAGASGPSCVGDTKNVILLP